MPRDLCPFPVVLLPSELADEGREQLGSRDKLWIELEGSKWLFKWSQGSRVGEDWAEVLASACAERLGLPHAEYALATWQGRRGVLSRKFHPEDYDLVLGNELLAERDPDYPTPSDSSRYERTPQHTLAAVAAVLDRTPPIELPLDWTPRGPVCSAGDLFAGYLLLDAWIGNTDRHHQNWGMIVGGPERRRHLTPTFDHASSLGAHLQDGERNKRLESKDRGYCVAAYVRRARSALYLNPTDEHALSTLEAVRHWAPRAPVALPYWLERLAGVEDAEITALSERVPGTHASAVARRFAAEVLRCNSQRLLDKVRT